MIPKKLFFPVGGGDELEERLYGALLVAKHYNTHLEILVSRPNVVSTIPQGIGISEDILKRLEKIYLENLEEDEQEDIQLLQKCAKKLGVKISDVPIEGECSVSIKEKVGVRSELVKERSKFCDMVVVAAPPKGQPTATFESAVNCSGKPVTIIPRKLESFNPKRIIIGWNNSPEASRAISEAIPMMQRASAVHIVSSEEYTTPTLSRIRKLRDYLKLHEIETTFEIIKTTFIPGEALLRAANDGGFDLIVAGAYSHKGIRERFLGGSSKYILTHTKIPTFVSH